MRALDVRQNQRNSLGKLLLFVNNPLPKAQLQLARSAPASGPSACTAPTSSPSFAQGGLTHPSCRIGDPEMRSVRSNRVDKDLYGVRTASVDLVNP